ncbi:MAG: SDR family oxidoreductase [Chloroflexi bacterium]|nr:SDR family oxidoreductase [Chloroflexota bacterium]
MTSAARPVAIVTGAAQGIGQAVAVRLGADGMHVIVTDISVADGRAVARTIRATNGEARFRKVDVSSARDWHLLARWVEAEYGRLDLVVSNAYTITYAAAHELDPRDWDRQLSVNLGALHLATRELIGMLRASRGSIVAVSSVHARRGFARYPAYAASKGGLISLCQQLAVEYGPDVRVNAVLPGAIRTPAWDDIPASEQVVAAAETCLARMGEPHEVAAVVSFLASADAAYVTGSSIVVDGGMLIK